MDFKDEKEAREYIKSIGNEYRLGCLEKKQASSCHLLADYLEAIDSNAKGAFDLYKENCLLRNYSHSCYKYGQYMVHGKKGGESWTT